MPSSEGIAQKEEMLDANQGNPSTTQEAGV